VVVRAQLKKRLETRVKVLARLAAPLTAVQVGMLLMGVVDTIMVGRLAKDALAGVALGSSITWFWMSFGFGCLQSVDPVIAQAFGAEEMGAVPTNIQRGAVLAATLTIPVVLALFQTEKVLVTMGQPEGLIPVASKYACINACGVLPGFLFAVMRSALQATNNTTPLLKPIIIANLSNVLLNWVLIFGNLGAPALGITGSAVATVMCRFIMALAILGPVLKTVPTLFQLDPKSLKLKPLMGLAKLGLPMGFQSQLESGLFTLTALMMGRLGTVTVAAHQITNTLGALSFMVPLGISQAVAVLVGNAVGKNDREKAADSALSGLIVGSFFMCMASLCFILVPRTIASIWTSDPETLGKAAQLIPIAGAFQLFDGLGVISAGSLRGLGETKAPFFSKLFAYWAVGLPSGLYLAFHRGMEAAGLWWGLAISLFCNSLVLLLRLRSKLTRPLVRIQIEG